MKRWLVLENGEVFEGEAFGSENEAEGEVVFNTSMTGYQEILSDPSYCGQIVVMTYPLIGNYGIHRDDFEAMMPAACGLIVKEAADQPSHWKSERSFADLLKEKGIPGLAGVDTRRLTKRIRTHGTLKGRLTNALANKEKIVAELRRRPAPRDLVDRVSTKAPYASPGAGPRVVIIDFGMKKGILREVIRRGADVLTVPWRTPAEEILGLRPDGILLTNGPGDPKDVPEAVRTVRRLLGCAPLFGICLGHQLLALACGGNTVKMPFGHRGANHPVKDLTTGRFFMTSQNHGYAVDPDSLADTGLDVTHININDGTVEGLAHKEWPAFSVQFHPEAAPGPEDSGHLFDRFFEAMITFRKAGKSHAETP